MLQQSGTVIHLALNSKVRVAVKVVNTKSFGPRAEDNLVAEIALLKELSHPHIVQMIDFEYFPKLKEVLIFMEHVCTAL